MDLLSEIFRIPENEDIGLNREIRFLINDDLHNVKAAEYKPQTTLNEYLRKTYLTGTKVMCREGGCGCCVVTITRRHPITNQELTFAVNSCLVSIFSCEGWRITTVEGVGNSNTHYHQIQKTLVKFNGTQCGFCTPGMIMTMYELSKKSNLKMADVENSFGGNICRCTGYRPILAAFKSLCSDADPSLIGTIPDIEDVPQCPLKDSCENKEHLCIVNNKPFGLKLEASSWYKLFTIKDIFQVLQNFPRSTYRFVAGDTAKGVYRDAKDFDLYIDISVVEELVSYNVVGDELIMGACISLTETMSIFKKLSQEYTKFAYLSKLADHIDLVASLPVRNIGTLAGNLSIKHEHHEFPSDIFLIFETVGAKVTIVGSNEQEITVGMVDYIYNTKMEQKVVKNIILPSLDDSYKYTSYKIMPRAQNAHALVNAGFLLKINKNHVVESARIVFGCINPNFSHAQNLEKYIEGKNIFDNAILQGCFDTLNEELHPDHVLPDPGPDFRKGLAISLFYKFVLSIAPIDIISPRNKSGGELMTRPISKGTQDYSTNESMYPVTKAISKVEAVAQVSGAAKYIIDQPDKPDQLFGALVLATAAPKSMITNIDTKKALNLKGVVAYFDKDDIKGKNNFFPFGTVEEEIFCGGTVRYYSQPIGMVVANTQLLAENGANLVEVTYIPGATKPVFTITDLLKRSSSETMNNIVQEYELKPKSKGIDVTHKIVGTYRQGPQYHYHMETQCCNVVPVEDGLDVFPSTQTMDYVQTAISECLQMPAHKINVKVRRLGGAFGGKISRNTMVACQAAVASYKLNKPVKMWIPFETNMSVMGKRFPIYATYEIGVNKHGVIQYLTVKIYSDYGAGGNEPAIRAIARIFGNCYKSDPFAMVGYRTKTDTHANTWCRAPGTTESMGVTESIMDHIAYVTKVDPIKVRMNNLDKSKHPKLEGFYKSLIKTADIDKRKKDISEFNKNNRWRKKGISVVPMAYPFVLFGNWNVLISIYQSDGTVAIAHGGIEMGQGINTKAAQVCAYSFGIPLEMVSIKPSNNLVSPNAITTGGSLVSEAVCYAIIKAAEILLKKMDEVKKSMANKNPTWLEVIRECYIQSIPLSAMYSWNPTEGHTYVIYGVCATEVEVDILTGLYHITRVDLLEDTGDSLSPEIDIGQVEGAFIMGQGYYTTEEIVLSEKGEILNNRTWNYQPPGATDIPIDFRVTFPKNNPNPLGILKSKATAEPPCCLSCVVPLAIRNAVASARTDADTNADPWYKFDGPSTVENTFINSSHDFKQYVL